MDWPRRWKLRIKGGEEKIVWTRLLFYRRGFYRGLFVKKSSNGIRRASKTRLKLKLLRLLMYCYCNYKLKIKNKEELKMKRTSFYFPFLLSIYIYVGYTFLENSKHKRWKGARFFTRKRRKTIWSVPIHPGMVKVYASNGRTTPKLA